MTRLSILLLLGLLSSALTAQLTLASLAKLLNKYSPDRWSYQGNHRKQYNFILDVSSTKALLKSLRKHGLVATGKAGTVEEITLERER
jgi:hypothetical protein